MMRRRSLVLRSIYAACLVAATLNHARILIENGLFWDYGGVHWLSAAYWTSLTVLDPIAALLLFVGPRAGILATAALITTNVIHNIGVTADRVPNGDFLAFVLTSPILLSQIAFMMFVLATARIAWAGAARKE